jgi:aminoglycoside/choline kinase family phosphotransferase
MDLLEDGLQVCLGKPAKIAALEELALSEAKTHTISRLHVTFTDGCDLNVIFKRLISQLGKEASREVLAYQSLLADKRLGAPQLYAAICDEGHNQYWLLLEDVGSRRLDRCGLAERVEAIRWAARMHATYQNRQAELGRFPWLGEHGLQFYSALMTIAQSRISELSHQATLDRFERLMATFQATIDYLDQQPQTLIHGDLSDHNLFVETDSLVEAGGPLRIRVIDWEWIAIGVGAWDLEKLLSGYDSVREELIRVYCEEFSRQMGTTLDQNTLGLTLHHCKIVRVLWKLGCPPPPPTGVTWDQAGIDRLLDEMSGLQQQIGRN